MAVSRGPSFQAKPPDSDGKSFPTRSAMSVCSEKLMRTKRLPAFFASAETMLDFPTPGLPSSIIARCRCSARKIRNTFFRTVGAST